MPKTHTRTKRKLMVSSRMPYKSSRDRSARPKTFSTEESAHAWAKLNKVKVHELAPAKKGKRFKIVEAQ